MPAASPRAAAWLARAQNRDGGFSFAVRGDPSDVDDTAAAIEALTAASAPRTVVARARRYLSAQENADGGFPLQPGGASNAQSTAWAVQALVAAGGSTQRAMAYLRARVTGSGAVQYAAGVSRTPVWVTAEALAALAQAPLPIRRARAADASTPVTESPRTAGLRCRTAPKRSHMVPARMLIGVPRESVVGERRVALVPEVVRKLAARGVEVIVEAGAGRGRSSPTRCMSRRARR